MKRYFNIFIAISVLLSFGCSPKQEQKQQEEKEQVNPVIKTDSVEILTGLIQKDSTNYQLFLRRAVHEVDEGFLDPALRDLLQALELNRDDPQIYLLLSDIYFLLEKPQNSIDALQKVLVIDPENQSAYLKLAEIYLLKASYKTAQQYAETAIRINRQSAEAFYLKAIARLEMGDTTDALNNLKVSYALDTMNYMTSMQIAAIYDRQKDTICKGYYQQALLARPNDEKALYLLAMFYQQVGDFKNALDTYGLLSEHYPNNLNAIYNSGYIYLVELEDFEPAAQAFQEVIQINPSHVQSVYNLGRAYEAMGLYNKARLQYRKSLELLPNYPLAIQGLNRLDEMGR
jgi:tetratricopeptide (TPR) repeat protein